VLEVLFESQQIPNAYAYATPRFPADMLQRVLSSPRFEVSRNPVEALLLLSEAQGLPMLVRLIPSQRDVLPWQSFCLPAPPEVLSALMKRH
jgi:hypothetical protein